MSEMESMLRPDLRGYEAASNLSFNEKVKAEIATGVDVAHFGFGQSPFPVPAPFVEALQKFAGRHEYLPATGLPALRSAILDFHREWDALTHFEPSNVVIGPGSKELLFQTIAVFGGDVILVSPAWVTYEPQTHLAMKKRHIVQTTNETRHKLTPDLLRSVVYAAVAEKCEKGAWKLMVFNDPNNPSGQSYSSDELKALADVCRDERIIVMSDEIYARLKFDGAHTSIASFYPEGTVLYSGFSKWASAGGWRAGYALFPSSLGALCGAVQSAASHTFTCASTPVQHALAAGLAHKEELRRYVQDSRRILKIVGDFVHRRLGEAGVSGLASQGGYYFMADFGGIRAGLAKAGIHDGVQMCDRLLKEARVALMPCDPYNLEPAGVLTTRFCFINFDGAAALDALRDPGEIDEAAFVAKYCQPTIAGVDRLCDWVAKHSGQ